MDGAIDDITREDVLLSETTKRDVTAEQAFEEALEACRRALDEERAAVERVRVARIACVRARPEGMTTTEVARRINRGR